MAYRVQLFICDSVCVSGELGVVFYRESTKCIPQQRVKHQVVLLLHSDMQTIELDEYWRNAQIYTAKSDD